MYNNHITALEQQLLREPKPFPQLRIQRKVGKVEEFNFEDFLLEGYEPHPKIAMDMAV